MTIVADENIDFVLIKQLRQKKLHILSIREENSGINDIDVLEFAFQNDALLITEDKDFGELAHRLKLPHKGILLLR
jgi:predicted nuclease of predicted toxin-antitoxin system